MSSTQSKTGQISKSSKETKAKNASSQTEAPKTIDILGNETAPNPRDDSNHSKMLDNAPKIDESRYKASPLDVASEEQFDFLVGLLTGSQQEEIEQIKAQIDDLPSPNDSINIDHLSEALPEALSKRNNDEVMAQAFTPVMYKSIDTSDPDEFARRLLPTIRRSIQIMVEEAVEKVVTNLNYSLEHSLNLRWRMEAFTTSTPFSEVVLAHTLKYRVEQVLFIHRETGLLLHQVNHEDGKSEDGDLISSMLSAIQSFIQDSFKVDSQSKLENVRMGDFELFIEQETDIIIAAAVRGVPTIDLGYVLQDAASHLQHIHAKELKAFDGDTSVFENSEATVTTLSRCLQSDLATTSLSSSKKLNPFLIAALSALVLFTVVSLGFNIYKGQQWRGYLNALKDTPGIMVIEENRRGGHFEISGLRDTFAEDPTQLLEQHNINPDKVNAKWESYTASDPILIEQRLKQTLNIPATVFISVESNNTVTFKGYACENWSTLALTVTRMLTGVNHVDTSGFESTPCN